MPQSDDQSPATKADLQYFLTTVMTALQDIENRMATKDQLMEMEERMGSLEGRMGSLEGRMGSLDQRMTLLELQYDDLRQDTFGTLKEVRIHDQRLQKLEAQAAR